MVLVPYVLLPPRSPQKRIRSPSPSDSSSRSTSPNLSPRKRPRNDRLVRDTVSRISHVSINSRSSPPRSEPPHTVVSNSFDEDDGDIFADPEDPVYFNYYGRIPVAESELPDRFKETGGEDDGTPIRRLSAFAIFKVDDRELVNPLEIDRDNIIGLFRAAGLATEVANQLGDDESDAETEACFIEVDITGFSAHHYEEALDEQVYIETKEAWYILDIPATEYKAFWDGFHLKSRIANSVLSAAIDNPSTNYETWVDEAIVELDYPQLESILKRDEAIAYLMHAIDRVKLSHGKIAKVPLIRHFYDESRVSNKKEQDGKIFVTEICGRIVNQHLSTKVSVVGDRQLAAAKKAVQELEKQAHIHEQNPTLIKWGPQSSETGFYESVELDGFLYKAGDIVAVAPGNDSNKLRAEYESSNGIICPNILANTAWFVQIQYFFEDALVKKFHGHWLSHGSRTLLHEVSHSQELLFLSECDDNVVASILCKCNVRRLGVDEVEEPDDQDPSSRDYFIRYAYDSKRHSFSDLPTHPQTENLRQYNQCLNCAQNMERRSQGRIRVVGNGLQRFGHVLHKDDFVYVMPDTNNSAQELLFIARIKTVDTARKLITVRYYERESHDSRCIRRSSRQNTLSIDNLDLDSRPFVESFLDERDPAIQRWLDDDENHFYLMLDDNEDHIAQCGECFDAHASQLEESKRYVRKNGKVPVMEMFAGAGGLSQGFCQTGFFGTECAVEWSYPAAQTFSINHPETGVLCTDINDFVRYVIQRQQGKEQLPLRSRGPGNPIIPDEQIPYPGSARVLCGGPPCQSFSRMNIHKKENDPRSSLPFTMLSIAEVFRPEFFLLENVTGLLDHSEKYTVHGSPIKMAMLKLLTRVLLALNYQVSPILAQAGQHGCVQNRPRFFLFAARRGSVLPKPPLPMHVFKPAQRRKLFIEGDFIGGAKRGRMANTDSDDEDGNNFAPHPGFTIKDATSDLPKFDWINPHEVIAQTAADKKTVQTRLASGIKQCDASTTPVGYAEPVPYLTEPQTRYQREMRRSNSSLVEDHVTLRYSSFVVEATVTVPLKPKAGHPDLPRAFHKRLNPNKTRKFGRLDENGPFKTAMTQVSPSSHGSQLLHPTQKRTITVLEAKRAQGFPDSFKLWSDASNAGGVIRQYYKHIGNAVPVPLAAAVSRSFEQALLQSESSRREDSPEAEL